MTFKQFSEANLLKTEKFYDPIQSWYYTDWACALAGEVGELCNIIKKMRRVSTNQSELIELQHMAVDDVKKFSSMLREEIYDCYVYLDLLTQRLGMDMSDLLEEQYYENAKKKGLNGIPPIAKKEI